MAQTIGTVTFTTLKGHYAGFRDGIKEITRDGVDGQAYRRTGKKAPPYVLTGLTAYSSNSNRDAAITSMEAMQGTIVSVTDDHGTVINNCIVLGVRVVERYYTPTQSGISGAYHLRTEWTLQETAVP